jgi:hypothetical protein
VKPVVKVGRSKTVGAPDLMSYVSRSEIGLAVIVVRVQSGRILRSMIYSLL